MINQDPAAYQVLPVKYLVLVLASRRQEKSIPLIDLGVKMVALRFGATVDSIMFGGGSRLEVSWVIALKTTDKRHTQFRGEVGVFAVGFLTASPTRITEQVDVR